MLPIGESNPVSRVTGGDTHHYTNEEILYTTLSTQCLCIYHPLNVSHVKLDNLCNKW